MKRCFYCSILTLAAMVGLVSSCSREDNAGAATYVVDNGEWMVSDSDKDLSVLPGDNFFMYCNGGFWNSTDLGTKLMKGFLADEVSPIHAKRLSSLPAKSLQVMLSHVAAQGPSDTTGVAYINKYLRQLEACTTKEDAWRKTGELMRRGFYVGFRLLPANIDGRLCYGLYHDNPLFMTIAGNEVSDDLKLLNNAAYIESLRPVSGMRNGRRAIDGKAWPMLVAWCEGLGLNPDDVLIPSEYLSITNEPDEKIAQESAQLMGRLESMQSADLTEYVDGMKEMIQLDLAFANQQAFDECIEQLKEMPQQASDLDEMTLEHAVEEIYNKCCLYEQSVEFAQAYDLTEAKERTLGICQELKQTFANRISRISWMSEGSKANCIEKLDNMQFCVGVPSQWYEEGLPDMSKSQSLVEDIVEARKALVALNVALAGKTISPDVAFNVIYPYGRSLTTLNASYYANINMILLFPAFIMEPFSYSYANEAYNYATASVFGHEITHGFDNNGAKFNKYGCLGHIMASEADIQTFNKRAQTVADCYSQFEVMPEELPGLYNDAAYTLGENIADLGGFELAYETYTNRLKRQGFEGKELKRQQQRYYEAFAHLWKSKYSAKYAKLRTEGTAETNPNKDVHSLPKERVNGVVMNTDAWYDLYDVQPGQKLYRAPEERAHVW